MFNYPPHRKLLPLPPQCQKHALVKTVSFVQEGSLTSSIIMCLCILTVFGIASGCIIWKRNSVAIKTRSPYLILIGFAFLTADCIIHTFSYTANENKEPFKTWKTQCRLSIFATVIFGYGILIIYYFRIWRIYKVY